MPDVGFPILFPPKMPGALGGANVFNYERELVSRYGGVYFPMQDQSGLVCAAFNPALAAGRNILIDGDMEAATTAAYAAGNSATLTKEAGTPHGGTKCLRVAYNAVNDPYAFQNILAVGKTYRITGWARGNGSKVPVITDLTQVLWSGTTSTSWQAFDVSFTAGQTVIAFYCITAVAGYAEFDDITIVQTNILASYAYPGAERLVDGNMEAAGTGAWTVGQSAILTKETSNPHSGSRSLRVTYNGVVSPWARQTIFTVGKRYRITGFMHGDGSVAPRVWAGGSAVILANGTSSTAWQAFDVEWVATYTTIELALPGGAAGNYVEYDDVSVTEVNPLNGAISGATLYQPAGKLGHAISFDGLNDYINIYSAELNSIFNPNAGTLLIFAQVSGAGVWTDGVQRYIAGLNIDVNNYIVLRKLTSNNDFLASYMAGGTNKQILVNSAPTTMMCYALTWDKTADQLKLYINGAQAGATQTGLGVWIGNLVSTTTTIGAQNSAGASPWSGLEAHGLLLCAAAPPSEILQLAKLGGCA